MNIAAGEKIKNLRKELNMSQEEFAEKISVSVRQLSRMETNQVNINISVLADILKAFGKTLDDFGTIFLDSKEYCQRKNFLELRTLFSTRRWDEYDQLLTTIKSKDGVSLDIQQLIVVATVMRRVEAGDNYNSFTKEDLEALNGAIRISHKDFDEDKVSEYLLSRIDVDVIHTMCHAYFSFEEYDRAIKIAKAVVDNKSMIARYAENKGDFAYIQALFYLISCYCHADRNNDALSLLRQTYTNIINNDIPTRNIGFCISELGLLYAKKGEEEPLAKSYLTRGYYWYIMEGMEFAANKILNGAKEYNIDIEVVTDNIYT